MKYKNWLLVPTLISTSIFTSSIVASADEYSIQENILHNSVGEKNEIVSLTPESDYKDSNQLLDIKTYDTNEVDSENQYGKSLVNQDLLEKPEVSATEIDISYADTNSKEDYHNQLEVLDTEIHSEIEAEVKDITDGIPQIDPEELFIDSTKEISNHSIDDNTEISISDDVLPEDTQVENNIFSNENKNDTFQKVEPKEIKSEEYTKNYDITSEEYISDNNTFKYDSETIQNKLESLNSKERELFIEEYTNQTEFDSVAAYDFDNLKSTVTNEDDKSKNILQTFSLQNDNTPEFIFSNKAARVKNNSTRGFYKALTSTKVHNFGRLSNMTLYINQYANYNGANYYKMYSGVDGPYLGWIKERDLNLYDMSEVETHNQVFQLTNDQDYLFSEPWGTNRQRIGKLDNYDNSLFEASQVVKLGMHNHYYGKIGTDYGWLHEFSVQENKSPEFIASNKAARVKTNSSDGFYKALTSTSEHSFGTLSNRTMYINQYADYNGARFYKVYSGAVDGSYLGWIKEQNLNLYSMSNIKTHHQAFQLTNRDNYLFSEPWGTNRQRVGKLDNNTNSVFQSTSVVKLGMHNHYYGKIGNNYGWLHEFSIEPTKNSPPPLNKISINNVPYNMTLEESVKLQMSLSSKPQSWTSNGWINATEQEVRYYLDTSHQKSDNWLYTFLNLNQSQNISIPVLNQNILNNKGILTNTGQSFSKASREHEINEIYLISHALHETGNGKSQLAKGVRLNSNGNLSSTGKLYYNMYGIGAYDSNPVIAGARYAQNMGWDTPEKAIIGGATFVSNNYFNRGQNTLYSMRWNPETPGTYQYATDVNWAYATAQNIKNYYDLIGLEGQHFTKYVF